MGLVGDILIGLIAILHVYILVLEMFLWTKKRTRKVFGISFEEAQKTKILAGNQGLYNGFLALGLFWSLMHSDLIFAIQLKIFFLSCVAVAGLYGGLTVGKRIIFVQAAPAILALGLVLFLRSFG